jgi:hypothetical protein
MNLPPQYIDEQRARYQAIRIHGIIYSKSTIAKIWSEKCYSVTFGKKAGVKPGGGL